MASDSGRLLSDEERQRFSRHLRENADSSRLLLQAMGKSPFGGIKERMRREIEAFEFVSRWLENTESQTISGGS